MNDVVDPRSLSVDELLKELRAREARAAGPGAAGAVGVNQNLRGVDDASLAAALRFNQKVIYGTDDRVDIFQLPPGPDLDDADCVVALFSAGGIRDNGDGTSTLQTQNFGASRNLCASEPFRTQPVGAFCSGFLVAPDIIASAGHCVTASDVTTVRFVFGFRMSNATTATVVISNSEIYSGVSVIARELVGDGADWALVRIDRPVTNHRIAKIRRQGKIPDGQAVHVIGHPAGLPAKFAGGAAVRDNSRPNHFVANLDTYGGNSGSPVFNADTHIVEGILVRGETDFVQQGSCTVSLVCPSSGCRGEDCTRTTVFASHLGAQTVGEAQLLLYDRNAGEADIVGFDRDGALSLDRTNSGWRRSWDEIVAGSFIGNGRRQALLYDRGAGEADIVGFDAYGGLNLDLTNRGWRRSWDIIVPGPFIGDGKDQALLYDRNAGEADVVGFDGGGALNLDFTNSGWRRSWDIIVAGDFIGNGRRQILLYDSSAGEADVVGFDANGRVDLDTTNSGWRTSWEIIVVGDFIGNGRQQILLYDRSAGEADVVGFDANGRVNLDATNSGWRGSWDMIVSGKFTGNGRSQILLYDRNAGEADVVGFDSAGRLNLDTTSSGWRRSWERIVAGDFVGNGRQQAALYDRAAGEADIVGFDSAGAVVLDRTNSGWRQNWDLIVPAVFLPV